MLQKSKKNILKSKEGFTLIEILVALLLLVLVLTTVTGGNSSNRDNLDDVIQNIERAIRFSVDEAALRNAVMRVNFKLDDSPQKYIVQFGPSGDFTLKSKIQASVKKASTSEEKRIQKLNKKRNQQFNSVQEFSDGAKPVHDNVRIVGFGSSLFEKFVTDTEGAIYIYPTGEKDAGIIILATDDEMAILTFNPFTLDMKTKYFPIDENIDYEELLEGQDELAIGYYKEWIKKNI